MAGFTEDIRNMYRDSNIVSRFILWNIGVFLVLRVIGFIFGFILENEVVLGDSYYYLSLPSQPMSLLTKPWTIFTHMFTHWDFMHILMNMLWLWFGGRILIEFSGKKQFIKSYWVGGFAGALFYMVAYNLIPKYAIVDASLIGASGAVYAVWLTAAATKPNYTVMLPLVGPIKLYILTIIFFIIALPMSRFNVGGILCHFGGAMFGYYYGRNLATGKDVARWFDSLYERTLGFATGLFKRKKPKMKVVQGGKYSRDDKEYNEQKKTEQAAVDSILDKVNRSGYDSLSRKEKEILDRFSNKG